MSDGRIPALAASNGGNGKLTVLVPAYNEAASISETVLSLQQQTRPPDEIVVIDDFSTDATGDIARGLGVTMLRPPKNTGSKAGAQTFALHQVRTEFCMAVDADTTLAPDAIEIILRAMDDPEVAAACGFVVPRHVRSIWERGRYVEYLFAFVFYKPIQDFYDRPLISSGCFSVYRTEALVANGGWSRRTMAEDMDLTWSFYRDGHKVRFVPQAVCYPIEPPDLRMMSRQLKRWSHGFIQNVRLHWRSLLDLPVLRSMIMVATWDALVASLMFLLAIPLLSILISPVFLLGYLVDLPAVAVPVLYAGVRRGEFWKALASLPCFFVLRVFNAVFMVRAAVMELILCKPLLVYEKGH
jgi:biofilm PGA synthesis N-glycosyltransferase PgaC